MNLIESLSEKLESAYFIIPINEPEAHARMVQEVEKIVGPMKPGGPPHITLLYTGKQTGSAIQKLAEKAAGIIKRAVQDAWENEYVPRGEEWEGPTVGLGRIDYFEPSPGSDKMVPVFVEVAPYRITKVVNRLVRGLASMITSDQFEEVNLHLTLGYLDRALTATEYKKLRELNPNKFYRRPKAGKITLSAGSYRKVREYPWALKKRG